MQKLKSLIFNNINVTTWIVGAIIVLVGEVMAASNSVSDDTISEKFRDQAPPTRALGFVLIGALLSHLAGWTISPGVTVQGDVNVEVKETK